VSKSIGASASNQSEFVPCTWCHIGVHGPSADRIMGGPFHPRCAEQFRDALERKLSEGVVAKYGRVVRSQLLRESCPVLPVQSSQLDLFGGAR
jgi:hypothetical protein